MNTWDYLIKQMLWKQLGFARDMKILDFGSGAGETAAHLAACNVVTAVEPSPDMLADRTEGTYTQLQGGIELVQAMPEKAFDMIVCHNVLEYVDEKETYLRELARVVKPGGYLSLVKHNRPGRVMQMTVLLNDFDMANRLLDGGNGTTSKFGDIRYYEDRTRCGGCLISPVKCSGAHVPSGICSRSRNATPMRAGSSACWHWKSGYPPCLSTKTLRFFTIC